MKQQQKQTIALPQIDEILEAFFGPDEEAAAQNPPPSPDFAARCAAASQRARDVLRMGRERPGAIAAPGSLREHFETLAQLASVQLATVLTYFGVRSEIGWDEQSARGLAKLARVLGLDKEETTLRLRVGYALKVRAPAAERLVSELMPAFANMDHPMPTRKVESLVSACEAGYGSQRRERLRRACAVTAAVFAEPA